MNKCKRCGGKYKETDPWNQTGNFCSTCTTHICNEININDRCIMCAASMKLSKKYYGNIEYFYCRCTGCDQTGFFITDKDKTEKLEKYFKMKVKR